VLTPSGQWVKERRERSIMYCGLQDNLYVQFAKDFNVKQSIPTEVMILTYGDGQYYEANQTNSKFPNCLQIVNLNSRTSKDVTLTILCHHIQMITFFPSHRHQ
jgi:hypothetical protein